MSELHHQVLATAARRALAAPSVFNTQPWHWVVSDRLELHRDATRQLHSVDPAGRLILTSCGAALHHARLALAVAGWGCEVTRLTGESEDTIAGVSEAGVPTAVVPEAGGLAAGVSEAGRLAAGVPAVTELVATLRLTEPIVPSQHQQALAAAIDTRHTDRRPFADELPDEAMLAIRAAVEAEALRVHRVCWDQMTALRDAANQAIMAELNNPEFLAELAGWTTRDPASGDGVALDTVARPVPRRVPTRIFHLNPEVGLDVPADGDRSSSYLILYGRTDRPADWLRAGEALSAALLTAAVHGVAVAPMSDLIEVGPARRLVRSLLAGMGYPYLVLRCGTRPQGPEPGHSPRRPPEKIIT